MSRSYLPSKSVGIHLPSLHIEQARSRLNPLEQKSVDYLLNCRDSDFINQSLLSILRMVIYKDGDSLNFWASPEELKTIVGKWKFVNPEGGMRGIGVDLRKREIPNITLDELNDQNRIVSCGELKDRTQFMIEMPLEDFVLILAKENV